MTRDERQKLCVKNWLKANGRGTVVAPTGCGKTRIAILCIKAVLSKYANLSVLVVVPTTNLKEQWEQNLEAFNIKEYCTVEVINSVIKHEWQVDMMVVDEIHVSAAKTFFHIYSCVKYKLLLGLTATFKRLDDRHIYIKKVCPIIDTITLSDTILNNWISNYTEYEVIIDVENIDEYKALEKANVAHFEFFNFDFPLVMSMAGTKGFENKKAYAKALCARNPKEFNRVFKEVNYHAIEFLRTMKLKKMFLYNHSKKIELARKIIEARPFSKIITFSNSVAMAEKIGGPVYSGRDSKKHSIKTLAEFNEAEYGVLNSVAKLIAGADIKGLNCGIVLGHNSSELRAVQLRGRLVRREGDKHSEVFNLVINNSKDIKWFEDAHKHDHYIKIDEENLYKVLNNEPFETYKKPLSQFNYRF